MGCHVCGEDSLCGGQPYVPISEIAAKVLHSTLPRTPPSMGLEQVSFDEGENSKGALTQVAFLSLEPPLSLSLGIKFQPYLPLSLLQPSVFDQAYN